MFTCVYNVRRKHVNNLGRPFFCFEIATAIILVG